MWQQCMALDFPSGEGYKGHGWLSSLHRKMHRLEKNTESISNLLKLIITLYRTVSLLRNILCTEEFRN